MTVETENTGRVHVIPRTPVVRMQDICKRFGGTVANVSVHFTLTEGEIHALVGENGAGKTTLMNILYGLHWPDSGRIEVFGRQTRHHSPADAIQAGIGMVHQHFMLVPTLTAAENVALGREPTRLGLIYRRRDAEEKFEAIAREFGFKVAPDTLVRNLSVGERQEVEIIKALSRDARIVILDEPTSVLSGVESERLFATIRNMAAGGKSVVFITHRLREVMDLADTVTVLRKGIVVASMPTAATSVQELSRLMVGAESVTLVPPASAGETPVQLSPRTGAASAPAGPAVQELPLAVRRLVVARDDDLPAVRGVDLVVNCGEIVAIAGVEGNGQTELVEAIVGLRKAYSGEIHLCGKDVTNLSLARRALQGLAFIPADRLRHGIVPGFTLWENCILGWQRSTALGRSVRLNTRATRRFARNLIKEFDVRPGNTELRAGALSGGNQQRLVLARELAKDPRLLVAAHPTRGLDIVSTEFVLRRLVAARNAGKGVLFVSSELDQVIEIADRVIVMFRGRFPGEFRKGRIDEKQLGFLICGGGSAAGDDLQMKKLSRWRKGVIVGLIAAFPIIAAGIVAVYYACGGKDLKKRLSNRFFPKKVEDRLAFSAEKTREFLRQHDLTEAPADIRLVVTKSQRKLELHSGGRVLKTYRVGLGKKPAGRKEREGDKRTPVGEYYVCTRNDKSKFFLFLGLSYPNKQDSAWGLQNKLIDAETNNKICAAIDGRACPPWSTALGGEVGIHGSGGSTDWTLGCIALEDEDIAELWGLAPLGTPVIIVE